MAIGRHRLEDEVVQGWERLPEGWAFTEVVGVAVDSRERVFVFCRARTPYRLRQGGPVRDAWGAGGFVRPHGIFIARATACSSSTTRGTRSTSSRRRALESRIGDGQPSDTGYVPRRSPVTRAAGPFNTVTNVAVAPDGELYVADGYGNARVHRFSADGRLLGSWGEPGGEPGSSTSARHRRRLARPRLRGGSGEHAGPDFSRDAPSGHWGWVSRAGDMFIDGEDNSTSPSWASCSATSRCPISGSWGPRRRPLADRAGVDPLPDGELIGRVGGEEALLPGTSSPRTGCG